MQASTPARVPRIPSTDASTHPSKDAGRRDPEKRIEENRLSYSSDYPKKPEVTEAQLAEFIATAPESYRSLAQDIQGFQARHLGVAS